MFFCSWVFFNDKGHKAFQGLTLYNLVSFELLNLFFLGQIQQIKKMGNMKDLLGMIPGVGKAVRDIDISNDSFKHIEAMIHSMTVEERKNPTIINGSRRQRIANGSGTTIQDVNKLIKQFDEMRKMMKVFSNKDQAAKMMRNMPGMRK